MPKTINIDELEEGMESFSEIKNKFGQTLVGAKIILNEKHKKILKTWNISSIEIVNDETAGVENLEENTHEEAQKIVSGKILWTARNKYEEEIINIALNSAKTWIKNGGLNASN